LLMSKNTDVVLYATKAINNLLFFEPNRQQSFALGVVHSLIALLSDANADLQTQAVLTLNNLSLFEKTSSILRENQGFEALLRLLSSTNEFLLFQTLNLLLNLSLMDANRKILQYAFDSNRDAIKVLDNLCISTSATTKQTACQLKFILLG